MKQTLIGDFIKKERNLTQKDFAQTSGLGLQFVRDLEQDKPTVRLDKVNQTLYMFRATAGPVKLKEENND
jgi:transcriptional regulator with XRE-family HTH domain